MQNFIFIPSVSELTTAQGPIFIMPSKARVMPFPSWSAISSWNTPTGLNMNGSAILARIWHTTCYFNKKLKAFYYRMLTSCVYIKSWRLVNAPYSSSSMSLLLLVRIFTPVIQGLRQRKGVGTRRYSVISFLGSPKPLNLCSSKNACLGMSTVSYRSSALRRTKLFSRP